MEQKQTLYDIAGNEIKPGDTIVQYLGHSRPARCGSFRELRTGKDGRLRVVADGDFKRPFLPGVFLNVSALGIPTEREQRPEVWPDLLREYNGEHVADALGYEARAHDQVLFWNDSKRLAAGTIRSFGGKTIIATVPPRHEGEVVQHTTVKDRSFIIYEGELPVPEELLYRRKKLQLQRPRPASKPSRKETLAAMEAFSGEFCLLYKDRTRGTIAEEDFQTAVKELMAKYNIQSFFVDN